MTSGPERRGIHLCPQPLHTTSSAFGEEFHSAEHGTSHGMLANFHVPVYNTPSLKVPPSKNVYTVVFQILSLRYFQGHERSLLSIIFLFKYSYISGFTLLGQ